MPDFCVEKILEYKYFPSYGGYLSDCSNLIRPKQKTSLIFFFIFLSVEMSHKPENTLTHVVELEELSVNMWLEVYTKQSKIYDFFFKKV